MSDDRFSRQSFLGPESEKIFQETLIAINGLGGGGSHIAQQMAHIGFKNYLIYDPDRIEESNLNRLVGATLQDVRDRSLKIDIAKRVILGINPDAKVSAFASRWQENPELMRQARLLFGCVDGFRERKELEVFSRRFLIPYIDIGLDVFPSPDGVPRMAGQVILSMPEHLCMECIGFLTEEKLSHEGARYGLAGPRAQVVWPNGILASAAVGIGIDLLTDWTKGMRGTQYLSYDGNLGRLIEHPRIQFADSSAACPHYSNSDLGDVRMKKI